MTSELGALTPAWLTEVLCACGVSDSEVVDISVEAMPVASAAGELARRVDAEVVWPYLELVCGRVRDAMHDEALTAVAGDRDREGRARELAVERVRAW